MLLEMKNLAMKSIIFFLILALFSCSSSQRPETSLIEKPIGPIQETFHGVLGVTAKTYYKYPDKRVINVKLNQVSSNFDEEPLFPQYFYSKIYEKLSKANQIKLHEHNMLDLDAIIEIEVVQESDDIINIIANVVDAETFSTIYTANNEYKFTDFDIIKFNEFKKAHLNLRGTGKAYTENRNIPLTQKHGAQLTVQASSTIGRNYKEEDGIYFVRPQCHHGGSLIRAMDCVRDNPGHYRQIKNAYSGHFPSHLKCRINGVDYNYDENYVFFQEKVPPGKYHIIASFEGRYYDATTGRALFEKLFKEEFTIDIGLDEHVLVLLNYYYDGNNGGIRVDVDK